MDKKIITMTIEETLQEGKAEFDMVIKMMLLFINLGEITNENKSLSTKVSYKERIVFSAMDKLMGGHFNKASDWEVLTDKQKDFRLNKTIESVTPKE
jgi:hypothetical protein